MKPADKLYIAFVNTISQGLLSLITDVTLLAQIDLSTEAIASMADSMKDFLEDIGRAVSIQKIKQAEPEGLLR